jgi:hypothetical protein
VAYQSEASTLISDDSNGFGDVFIHDLRTRKNKRISVSSKERQALGGDSYFPAI